MKSLEINQISMSTDVQTYTPINPYLNDKPSKHLNDIHDFSIAPSITEKNNLI
jgi:hypothetical protein